MMNKTTKISIIAFILISVISCSSNHQVTDKENIRFKNKDDKEGFVGNDRDGHDCIGSAGYVWSSLLKECIRPFERGLRLSDSKGEENAYAVFNTDSSKVQLFIARENEIILDEHNGEGGRMWFDDTNNIKYSLEIEYNQKPENNIYFIAKNSISVFKQKNSY